MFQKGQDPRRGLLVGLAVAACMMLPASAMAQNGAQKSCASDVPTNVSADQRAVLVDAAAKADAMQLPAGATKLDCNVALGTIAVPAGATVTPSPIIGGTARGKIRDNGGSGQLQAIACGMTGQPYYVSTPTYIHLLVNWSCNAWYQSMSGAGNVQTPSSGSFSKSYRQTSSNYYGSSHLEFSGVAWYGYHNRAVWEYGYFAFAGVGLMYVQTSTSYI
ncbi:MAG: hypothetical protein V7607_4495 [Solirubrobacteraceae bacterium]